MPDRVKVIIMHRTSLVFLLLACFVFPAALLAQSGMEPIVNGRLKLMTAEDAKDTNVTMHRNTLSGPSYYSAIIPATQTGTGSSESIWYMEPSGYNPGGAAHPLMVCWHGYDHTAYSVISDSFVDEECEERNWIFLSITGVHEFNFGFLKAQQHCTAAIDYLINDLGLNIDVNRIYMAGYSMGATGATSYANRHLSFDEGYPVAGLILVAGAFDLAHAYNLGDPGVKFWLPQLLGGTPLEVPFAYKQISTLTVSAPEYILDESMGQNLRHNMPIYITYAGNDPLTYVPVHNQILINMLSHVGANYMVNYFPFSTNPHHWQLLDVEEAFDYVETYSLGTRETESIGFLADRTGQFLWADVETDATDTFAVISATADAAANKLTVAQSINTKKLIVDCDWTGLAAADALTVDYESSYTNQQTISLAPIAEPTYVVDSITGVLYSGYDYDAPSETISLSAESPIDLEMKASYEVYNLDLTATEFVPYGDLVDINMSGGDPYDSYLYFFAISQVETKVGVKHILVYPFFPTLMVAFNLDAVGTGYMSIRVPNDPLLEGVVIHMQYLTYGPILKEISNMVSTTVTQ